VSEATWIRGPGECAKCGAIFPADAVTRCTVCGSSLKEVSQGDKGTPWKRRDTVLWFLSFPGAEIVLGILVILGLFGVLVAMR
jgi:hypothetical protein